MWRTESGKITTTSPRGEEKGQIPHNAMRRHRSNQVPFSMWEGGLKHALGSD